MMVILGLREITVTKTHISDANQESKNIETSFPCYTKLFHNMSASNILMLESGETHLGNRLECCL